MQGTFLLSSDVLIYFVDQYRSKEGGIILNIMFTLIAKNIKRKKLVQLPRQKR